MKKARKPLSALLILTLALCLFGACGDKVGPEAETPAPASQAPATAKPVETPAPTEEPGYFPLAESETLSMLVTFSPSLDGKLGDITDLAWIKWIMERTNIELEIVGVNAQKAAETVTAMFAGGSYPGIMDNFANYYLPGADKAIDEGIIYPLDDYLEEFAPEYLALINKDEDILKSTTTLNGHIPFFYCLKEGNYPDLGIVLRQDWLEDIGYDGLPKTYDDYYEVLKAFKTEKEADAALWIPYMGYWQGNEFANGYEVFLSTQFTYLPLYQDNGTMHFSPTEEGFKQYLTTVSKWYEEGLIYQDFTSDTQNWMVPNEELISNGRTGVWVCTVGNLNNFQRILDGLEEGAKVRGGWDAMPAEDYETKLGRLEPASAATMNAYAITDNCENVELAVRMMNELYTEDGIFFANYGTEGVTFNYDNGNIVLTDLILANPDGLNIDPAFALYAMFSGPTFLNALERAKLTLNEVQMEAVEMWTTDPVNKIPGGVKYTAEENEEKNTIAGDIKTYFGESIVKFIVGEMSIEEDWDAYVAVYDTLGVNRLIEIYQTAYDRYLAG